MTLVERVQKFLHQKSIKPTKESKATKEDKGKRKNFIQNSNIHKSTISKIVNSSKRNPKINTLIDIAKCFRCTTDEVLCRGNYFIISKEYKFNDISLNKINNNLRNFINAKLKEENLTPSNLSKELGFSENLITGFLNNHNKSLSSEVIFALADYFKVSIDEMIGRISTQNQEPQILEKIE